MQEVSASSELLIIGFVLVLAGTIILILGIVLAAAQSKKGKGNLKSAGIIVIGPVPIVFGSDKKSIKTILVLTTTLTALLVAAMLVYYFLFR